MTAQALCDVDDLTQTIRHKELRDATTRFFTNSQDLITNKGYDLVVMAARRLPCLYQALVDAGMSPLAGATVVSDRALGAMTPWRWRRVLILDDTVILGSTLARLRRRISAMPGVQEVVSRSICLDDKESAGYLVEEARITAEIKVSSADLADFSEDVVKLLFKAQTPFFTDFPVTKAVDFTKEEWLEAIHFPGWRVADVTAPLLGGAGTSALVLVPTAALARKLIAGLPEAAVRLLDLVKLRAYCTEVPNEQVRVKIVPICLVKPAYCAEVEGALSALLETFGAPKLDDTQTMDETEHLRYFQYFASLYIVQRVVDILHAELPLEPLSRALLFGDRSQWASETEKALTEWSKLTHSDAARLQRVTAYPRPFPLMEKRALRRVLWEQQELLATVGLPSLPASGEVTKAGLAFTHAVASVFGYISQAYEMPERRRIAKLPSVDEYERLFASNGSSRLLDSGFSFDEIGTLMSLVATEDEWGRAAFSLALDIANDLGIIVPITSKDDVRGIVYRAYRLGETAFLAAVPFSVMQWGKKACDPLTQCLSAGYPLMSKNHPIDRHAETWGGLSPKGKHGTAELRRLVRRALPGRSSGRLEGTVVQEEWNSTFIVALRDSNGGDAGLREFEWHTLKGVDGETTIVNSDVTWTQFQRDDSGNILKSSAVRLRPRSTLDPDTAQATADEWVALLADGE